MSKLNITLIQVWKWEVGSLYYFHWKIQIYLPLHSSNDYCPCLFVLFVQVFVCLCLEVCSRSCCVPWLPSAWPPSRSSGGCSDNHGTQVGIRLEGICGFCILNCIHKYLIILVCIYIMCDSKKATDQLFVTLYTRSIYPSLHKQLFRTLFEAQILFE